MYRTISQFVSLYPRATTMAYALFARQEQARGLSMGKIVSSMRAKRAEPPADQPPGDDSPDESKRRKKAAKKRRKESIPSGAPGRKAEAASVDMARLARDVREIEAYADRRAEAAAIELPTFTSTEVELMRMLSVPTADFERTRAVEELVPGESYAVSRGLPSDSFDTAGLDAASLAICDQMGTSPRDFASVRAVEDVLPGEPGDPFTVPRDGDNWEIQPAAYASDGAETFQVPR